MSTEAIFSLVAGILILGERLVPKEMLGCLVMVIAIVLAQVDLPKRKKKDGTSQG